MRKSSLRKTTLLSLLGISSAATSSWGEPFVVEPIAATSTENLLPSTSPTPTWGDAFTVENSAASTPASSLPTSEAGAPSLAVDTASPIPSNLVTEDVTVITGIQSAVGSRTASFDPSSQSVTGTGSLGSSTESATGASGLVEATGAAVPVRGFKKMGFAGAMAGAAGVLFV
ncbi:hypothetical protein BKA58DRAFT_103172 [Alternaria rosae]|uniref:uncharacterized protein n=1 Tax=Alternaria rosae TaxID=1187941 RepID=UPI001E8DA293|nr:uncharacterized protein BKA58DRAFT_103172 [Alternaria rosae]KAH6878796.1 hypothetical protein BKA58DRAFT_103172 [Alternaria rosae]